MIRKPPPERYIGGVILALLFAFLFNSSNPAAPGSSLVYSTYLGGSGDDYGQAVVLDGLGGAYITGYTLSSNFPTTPGSYSTVIGITYKDAFVVKISD